MCAIKYIRKIYITKITVYSQLILNIENKCTFHISYILCALYIVYIINK